MLSRKLFFCRIYNTHVETVFTRYELLIFVFNKYYNAFQHYSDVIMSAIAPQIPGVLIIYSIVCSDQRKHQSSAALAFVRGIHRWPVNSPHKWQVTRKCLHLMTSSWVLCVLSSRKHTTQPYTEIKCILVDIGDTLQCILLANATYSTNGVFISINLYAMRFITLTTRISYKDVCNCNFTEMRCLLWNTVNFQSIQSVHIFIIL